MTRHNWRTSDRQTGRSRGSVDKHVASRSLTPYLELKPVRRSIFGFLFWIPVYQRRSARWNAAMLDLVHESWSSRRSTAGLRVKTVHRTPACPARTLSWDWSTDEACGLCEGRLAAWPGISMQGGVAQDDLSRVDGEYHGIWLWLYVFDEESSQVDVRGHRGGSQR